MQDVHTQGTVAKRTRGCHHACRATSIPPIQSTESLHSTSQTFSTRSLCPTQPHASLALLLLTPSQPQPRWCSPGLLCSVHILEPDCWTSQQGHKVKKNHKKMTCSLLLGYKQIIIQTSKESQDPWRVCFTDMQHALPFNI